MKKNVQNIAPAEMRMHLIYRSYYFCSYDMFCLTVPTSLKQLQKIINELDVSKKIEKIENLLRDQQVHCGTSNKKHLMNFFSVLLDYTDSIFSDSTDEEV